MKKNEIRKKVLAGVLSAAMVMNVAPALAFAGEADISTVSQTEAVEQPTYVWMNIPYADFYKADLQNNDIEVDAFSSATLNKSRTSSLVGGSYHVNEDGSDISGVTFPVKINENVDLSQYRQVKDSDSVTIKVTNRGQTSETTYNGKDALFESADYSWYAIGEETPDLYKEVSLVDGKLSFSEIKGSALTGKTTVAATEDGVDFTTDSSYGDYELHLNDLEVSNTTHQIYGVIIAAKDKAGKVTSYGLRHMENIWKGIELSWCTGFTEAIHGCQTSSKPYESMMGQTIDTVTYYTDKGVYEVTGIDQYVPIKFDSSSMKVENAAVTSGSADITLPTLPESFEPEYSVVGLENVTVNDGKLTYTAASASRGNYTLIVKDASGIYADILAEFTLTTTDMPASFDAEKAALVPASGFTTSDMSEYVRSITSVTVNGQEYAASGRGSTVIINEDGTLKTDAEPIKANGTYEITVKATGFENDLSFTYTRDVAEDFLVLNTAIQNAKKLSTADYCANAAWSAMQEALKKAEAAVTAAQPQAAVDEAAANLNASIAKLTKHSMSTQITKATATTDGKIAERCGSCGYEKASTVIPKVSNISLSKTSYTYNGKVQKPSVTVKDSKGNAVAGYSASWSKGLKNAGTYTVKVTLANDKYNVSKSLNYTIKKAAQSITKAKTSASVKAKTLKKKAQSFKIQAKAKGKVTYKKSSGSKKITVSKAGKVTLKKGLKKGTYKVKVKITAAKTTNYKAKTTTKTIKIKVK